jgi:hypothetical protein
LSLFFSRLSEKIGNIVTLKITIVIWLICLAAYLLDAKSEYIIQFYVLGGTIGMVLGQFSLYPVLLTQNYYQKPKIMLLILAFCN